MPWAIAHCICPALSETTALQPPHTNVSYLTPEVAEAAFYAAFEARDLDGMMAVWGGSDNSVLSRTGSGYTRDSPIWFY